MRQRTVWTSIAITLALAAMQHAHAEFADVSQLHPNHDAIAFLETQGIVEGYPVENATQGRSDRNFKPDVRINRAEFAKIIMEQVKRKNVENDKEMTASCTETTKPFKDTPEGAWFTHDVCLAREAKIVEGYADGTFRPNQPISIVEAAKMVIAAAGIDTRQFVTRHQPWYEPSLRALEQRKGIPASMTSLEHFLTRGEMAELMQRTFTYILYKPSMNLETLKMGKTTQIIDDKSWTTYIGKNGIFTLMLPSNWKQISPFDGALISIGQIGDAGDKAQAFFNGKYGAQIGSPLLQVAISQGKTEDTMTLFGQTYLRTSAYRSNDTRISSFIPDASHEANAIPYCIVMEKNGMIIALGFRKNEKESQQIAASFSFRQ